MPRESFFVASNAVTILRYKPCIYTAHQNFWKRLFKFEALENVSWNCKLEHLKIVTNDHQHKKTTEDEEVYFLSKFSNSKWKTI